ncbi:hypothetical protein FALBO_16397 [Fusarium albosuccineum]|uniref:Uncharacterized protein n=1 Tax=Fusarium albosuccineum TaxID=1237068 RepID=A0A8H4KGT6_9HYPO|nr:hypothetical protein FALBO_16397 [Fusarium albosuccineum]
MVEVLVIVKPQASIKSESIPQPTHFPLSRQYNILASVAVTNKPPMSHSPRKPSPRRSRRRHGADPEPGWKRKLHKWARTFVQCAALQRRLFKPPSQPRSSRHRGRPKPDRHWRHHERSPESKGRRQRRHPSRRDLSDASSDESESDDGYDSDLSNGLSSPEIDDYEDLCVAIPSASKEQLTASLRNPPPQSQTVPITGLKLASANPGRVHAKDRRDGTPSLHGTLGPGEDHAECYRDTSPSSLPDEDEGSNLRSCSYGSGGDQEENVAQAATHLQQVAHVDAGDIRSKFHESEDEVPVTDLDNIPIGTPSENEGEVDDGLGQDEGYASMSRETSPEEPERSSTIASVVLPSSQEDASGPGDSKAELAASYSSPGIETPSPQPQPSFLAKSIDFSPGSIVRRKSWRKFRGRWRFDYHPHVITQSTLDDDGKTVAVMACLCTSRPKLDLFTEQYKEQKKKHFCYLGGIEEGDFVTPEDTPKPTEAELDIQGPPMPKQTYIELEEGGPFDPGDFKSFGDQPRRLTLTSREKFFNLYTPALHGCKKSPPGSVPAAQPEILM